MRLDGGSTGKRWSTTNLILQSSCWDVSATWVRWMRQSQVFRQIQCINKFSALLPFCALFQVQLLVHPPVLVSDIAKAKSKLLFHSETVSLSHFGSFLKFTFQPFMSPSACFLMCPSLMWCSAGSPVSHFSFPMSPRCAAARAPCASLLIGLSVAMSFHPSTSH